MSTDKTPGRSIEVRNRKLGLETEYLIDGKVHGAFEQGDFSLFLGDDHGGFRKTASFWAGSEKAGLKVRDGSPSPISNFNASARTLTIRCDHKEYRVELGSRREWFSVGSEIFVGEDLVGIFWIKTLLGFGFRAVLDLYIDLQSHEAVYLAHLINFAPDDALLLLRGKGRVL